ncbi:BREX-1 system adenine-specific DNA-methyltransferase PglX [Levilactobacillus namurensis]|uniref:BREX-1 system adenine-specific DNA-methyltransferase PglX n=1 Tax=Levilactobacillus namurensis TaxID=380393 RepID=UPI0028B6C05A|nr:BREX-1 system adenine-specific DNA-methyltransferase PglX [Levilactobacillus namurensis]MDT7019847.1 BREX-1 system adenine-specific DNA-methyltransferase PglX [Levilactobacillus namurensis]WNN65570.1 BREX-1 system adenine-specific DNA-methyltransferase PglX [Levilactobacillus namurensis]
MDKTAIKKFAVAARRDLIEQIKLKARAVGITTEGPQEKAATSTHEIEYYQLGNMDEQHAITGKDIVKRQELATELQQRAQKTTMAAAFNDLVEEVAYTWFNRIIAIRFMEVNGYLPSRTRVLSSTLDRNEPDIMVVAMARPDDLNDSLGGFSDAEKRLIDRARETEQPTDMDALYRMLFIKQANALNQNLPYLFEPTDDYAELLFTPSYNDGVIRHLIEDVDEADFDVTQGGQVEIIGWLYQYYNTEPKEKAIGSPKSHKFRDTEIASATQIFTPDWIVKYMVENSLGKLWIKSLKQKGTDLSEGEIASSFGWQYYMVDAQQDSAVLSKLARFDEPLASLDVKDIRLIDPSMGSGHILVYAFDVLETIYESEGYSKREAAQMILENNLCGLDIDTRAFQLSYFAVMMKARQYNRHALTRLQPKHIFDVPGLGEYTPADFDVFLNQLSPESRKLAQQFLRVFDHGNELGSLIRIPINENSEQLVTEVESLDSGQLSFELIPLVEIFKNILDVVQVLHTQYQIVITNPPYMGSSRMNAVLSKFAKKNFPNSKSDLFSMFIERWNKALLPGGYNAMVTMQSWMFLSSFEKMRRDTLKNYTISNLMHMENNVMGIAFGTAVTIFRNIQLASFSGTYHQIKTADVAKGTPTHVPISGNRFNRTNQANFTKIPGMPIAYWASKNLLRDFEVGTRMDELVTPKQGLATANNNRFLRQWFEVQHSRINFQASSLKDAEQSGKKWFPYNKGGSYRKWYGNYDYVVNWEDNGYEIRHFTDSKGKVRSRPQNTDYYFHEAITWSDITSGSISMRYRRYGSIHDVSGMSAFSTSKDQLMYCLGLLNSTVGNYIFKILNPTIHFQIGNLKAFPVIATDKIDLDVITQLIMLSSVDWGEFETSWDFGRHPLLTHIADEQQNKVAGKLQNAFQLWQAEAQNRFDQLKANEEALNRIFIDLYGLNDELSPEVADKDVSVRLADETRDIKSFLSYFVGVVFGRYSLDVPGLAFAGGQWDDGKYQSFIPNQDNLLVLTDADYFGDSRDVIYRLREFLTATFGAATVDENLAYIATALGKKGTSPEDVIRKYFVDDFFKDHNKLYQKRPIYWEFSTGRNNGFKALMYLHRYEASELAMVRTDYLHALQGKYETRLEQLTELAANEPVISQKKRYEKARKHLDKQLQEVQKYDAPLQHLASQRIELDLDDGVLVNHQKLQGDEKILTKIK